MDEAIHYNIFQCLKSISRNKEISSLMKRLLNFLAFFCSRKNAKQKLGSHGQRRSPCVNCIYFFLSRLHMQNLYIKKYLKLHHLCVLITRNFKWCNFFDG